MIVGIGTDIVKIERVNTDLARFLGPKETAIYDGLTNERRQEFLAGRWAAKEAIFKALDKKEHDYKMFDIFYDESGKPVVEFENYKINISISHEDKYAIAYVVVEL